MLLIKMGLGLSYFVTKWVQ